MEAALSMKQIYKAFPGVVAVDHVDLEVQHGQVLALIGENGAGKSTLMKILSGAYQCDSGQIFIDGQEISNYTPKQGIDYGISVIYQELNYLSYMTVAENILLGNIPLKKGTKIVDRKALRRKSLEIQKQVGIAYLDPDTLLGKLTIGEKQLVEIAKAYARNMKILVMDEPTSALNDRECEKLFHLIENIRTEGKAVIYISHKLDEILRVSDRIVCMRDGRRVGALDTKDAAKNQMISMMVGREISEMYPMTNRTVGAELLRVAHMSGEYIRDVSFTLHRGEILGFFGLMGAGCEEIVTSVFGALPTSAKTIYIDGRETEVHNTAQAIANGMAYVPSERKTEGLILKSTVKKNATLLRLKELKKALGFDSAKEETLTQEWIKKLRIKTPSSETVVESLSGGNQQKVVLAKWMMNEPKILILNEPTRGIDVGAKAEIYRIIDEFCQQGLGVLMVSSEMAEVMSTSDRIAVVYNGEIRAEFTKAEATQEKIMQKAIGE